ncbi:MAG: hypothetical protein O2960_02090 [Verrucomicrobia bacterium]|nr:hypothetical protein [Verrucomicrobiota bacterium]
MIADFCYAVDQSVLELFTICRQREREELLRIFQSLAKEPFRRGDFVQKAASGREMQVKRFGHWLITYWPDQPVLELRIVDLKRINR